ncbi:hypothetical protein [Erythrobacter sp. YT30]|uniref:hypothetical protein n=1 Tax=Erythrobacter sp. YT30 TaxID=1735012 RepID=UPI0012E3BCF5|nr:hypothetical protein [Erythrobacter sp. YT30]
MSPEEALAIIRDIPEVSSARQYRRRADDDPSQLRISLRSEKIQIAGMPFEIEPRFAKRRLDQVWLVSTAQCSNNAVALLEELSAGLATKYPEAIFEEEFSRVDLSRAHRNSRSSGQSVRFSRIYSSRDVAVVLTFSFSSESPPPYPGSRNRFALSLYQIARSNYRQRSQDCDGTGHNRMGIALQYMTRSSFDARAAKLAEEIEGERAELIDQL